MSTPLAKPRRIWTAAIISLLACTSFGSDSWVLRENGIGPVKIGVSLTQLKATVHEKLIEDESGSDNCFYVHVPGEHIGYMILDGHVARVDITAPGIRTSTGIQVGYSEARVRRIYGSQLKVTPHKYVDNGHYLTVRSYDGHYGIRFETDNEKITGFYAGRYDAIQYIEGCE